MFELLKRLFDEGKIGVSAIWNAVDKGWLTEEQAKEILAPRSD